MKNIPKKNKLIKLIACVFSLLVLFSCKDKTPKTNPNVGSNPNPLTLADFYATYAEKAQSFTVSTASATSIVGTKGTTINIPALAFKTSGGTQILGQVIIKLTELYTKKDLVLNKKQTTTVDDILQTKGMVNIKVNQGEEPLYLDVAKTVTINYPATVTPGNDMFAMYGNTDLISGKFTWLPDTTGTTRYAGPVINPVMSYSLVSDSLNWVQIGKFNYGAGLKTSFTITVHGNYNWTNTDVFIYFPSNRSIAYLDKPEQQSYTATYKIASGTVCNIIAISRINSNFYMVNKQVTITPSFVMDLDLTQNTESGVITMLDNL
ncbi:MAG: hypothetical protein IPM51_07860 [Sphingobacteriaceae bacterium]|nr:hypothetical protein [Sphingobacteriaceae bacterium]